MRSTLIVPGDPSATANNILEAQWLFRLGFASDAFMVLADVALAVLLYMLLLPVSKTLALLAAVTRLAQATVLGMNLLNYYAALLVLESRGSSAFAAGQDDALASLFLRAHSHGYDIALLFFGLHCLILGWLIVKSGFIPRILGGLMAVTGVVYLVGTFTRFLWPELLGFVSPLYMVAVVSELSLCLWLLAAGAIRWRGAPTASRVLGAPGSVAQGH